MRVRVSFASRVFYMLQVKRINKLEALDAALCFIQLLVLKNKPTHPWHQRAMRIRDTLKAWKATLRKKKTQKRAQRLQELSATDLSIKDLTKVLDCRDVGPLSCHIAQGRNR